MEDYQFFIIKFKTVKFNFFVKKIFVYLCKLKTIKIMWCRKSKKISSAKFEKWLERDPKEWNGKEEDKRFLDLFWDRNF